MRDKEKTAQLQAQSFAVLRFWEHDLRDDLAGCVIAIKDRLERAEWQNYPPVYVPLRQLTLPSNEAPGSIS